MCVLNYLKKGIICVSSLCSQYCQGNGKDFFMFIIAFNARRDDNHGQLGLGLLMCLQSSYTTTHVRNILHALTEDVLGSVQVKEIEQEVVPERGAVRASTKGQQKAEEISKRFTGQHFQGSYQFYLHLLLFYTEMLSSLCRQCAIRQPQD